MQVQTLDVPQQNVITKDNITVTIHAVIYYSIINVEKAAFSVANVGLAVANFAQSTLRYATHAIRWLKFLQNRDR